MTASANHPTLNPRRLFSFLLGPAGAALISFGSTFLITYVAEPADFGRASLFILFVNMAVLMSVAGTDQAYVRFFYGARREGGDHRLLHRTLRLSLVLPVLIAVPLVVMARPLTELVFGIRAPEMVPIFLVTLVLLIFGRFGAMTLRLRGRAVAYSATAIIRSAVYAAAILGLALWWTSKFHAMVVAFALSVIAFTASSWWLAGRDAATPTASAGEDRAGELLRYGLPLVPAALAMWLLESTDKLALRTWATVADVGIYATAFRLMGPLTILRQGFAAYWAPAALEAHDAAPGDTAVHRRVFDLTCAVAVPLGVVTALGMPLVAEWFAPSYRPAAAVMPFLVFIPIFYAISEVTVIGVAIRKRTLDHLWITGVTVAVNVAGNAWLVPRDGARGAAIATAFAYAVFFVLRTIAGERAVRVGFAWRRLVIGVALLTVVAVIASQAMGWLTRAAVAAVAVSAGAAIYRVEWAEIVQRARGAGRA